MSFLLALRYILGTSHICVFVKVPWSSQPLTPLLKGSMGQYRRRSPTGNLDLEARTLQLSMMQLPICDLTVISAPD